MIANDQARPETPTVTVARRILADAEQIDFADIRAMACTIGALREAVRMLLAEAGEA